MKLHSYIIVSLAISFLGLLVGNHAVFGQITGSPFIENYNAKDYNASVSNFDIVQDAHGRMYFANWSGVLRFDGAEWRKISVDNGKSAYEIDIDANDVLHVASTNDFGYLSIDSLGREYYVSLTPDLAVGEILEVVSSGNKTYYLTEKYLFEYAQNTELKQLDFGGQINYDGSFHANGENAFSINDKLYVNIKGIGLTVLENNILQLIPNGDILRDEMIISSTRINEQHQLILTASGNTYEFVNNTLAPVDIMPDNIKAEIVKFGPKCIDAKKVNGSLSVALGTFKNGVYYIKDGKPVFHLSQKNGLANNEVRDVMFVGSNLWVATQNGISKLTGLEAFRFWKTENQDIGLIWELYKYKGRLYLATTKGLYVKEGNVLVKLGASTERSFYLYEIDGKLHLNNYSGINEVVGGELKLKKKLEAANRCIVFDNNLFVMSNIGLYRYPLKDGVLGDQHLITKNFEGQSFGVEVYDNSIWFSVVNAGIVKISKGDDGYDVKLLSNENGLPDDTSVELVQFEGQLYFGTNEGFFQLNQNPSIDSSDFFIPKQFSTNEGEVSYPVTDQKGNVWFVSSVKDKADRLASMTVNAQEGYHVEVDRYRLLNDQALTIIYPDTEETNAIWVGGSKGLYKYTEINNETSADTPFYTHFRSISIKDSVIFYGLFKGEEGNKALNQSSTDKLELSSDQNNLIFQYGATSYEAPNLNEYSYYLEGFDEGWSNWSTENKKEYTNIDAGKYTFKVKARDLYKTESSVASFKFIIKKPWYYKPWAIAMFVFLTLVIIRIVVWIYTYRLRIYQHNLERIVESKTIEVLEQKKQIEYKNELLTNQTNELENHRDEILEQKDLLEKKQLKIKTQNEKLKQLNLTKDKFFSIIGHDLKNPISSLISFSNLLTNHIDRLSKEEIRTLAVEFDKTLKNSYNLLDNLLEWSRSQTEQIEYKPVNFDLRVIINENRELIAAQAISKNINIKADDIPRTIVYADKNCINTVLRNLISNAIKFTNKGGEVSISVDHDADSIIVSVSDNGVGMNKETVKKIFKIDNKHATLGTDKEKGTGLGLVLCKEFVEINKGKIWLKSEPGKGSTFYFSLPGKK